MTPEEKSLLERTYKMVEENNGMLRSLRRSNRYSIAFRVIYWVLIIGLSFGAFYFIQPYVNTLVSLYSGTNPSPQSASNSLQDLFK